MTNEQFQRIVSMGVYATHKGWIVEWRNGYLMLHLPDLRPADMEGMK